MGSGDSNPCFIYPPAREPEVMKPTILPLDGTASANRTGPWKLSRPSTHAFVTANGWKHKDAVSPAWLEQVSRIASQCHCTVDEIEDIYPCTPLQEGMMALTLKDSTAYTVMYKYHLPHSIEIDRLKSAWDQATQANPILRTRIVPMQHSSCMQVVLRDSIPWIVYQGYSTYDQEVVSSGDGHTSAASTEDQSCTVWQVGSPLARLIWDPSAHVLTVLMHHALCDDWSMRILLRDVDAAYQGQVLVARPFRPLIEYIEQSKERSARFWREQFANAHNSEMKPFPSLPVPGYTPVLSEELTQTFPYNHERRLAFPINAKIRLAWAMLQSLYTRSGDVLFGAIDTGRGIPLKGIEELSGPSLVCIPVRVQLQPQQTITDALQIIQGQYANTIEFAHIGLQHLMHLEPGTAAGCRFNTLLAVEPEQSDPVPSIFKHNWEVQKTYDTYPLILRCRPSSQSLTLQATFDPAILEPQQTDRILHQLAHIYCQVEGHPELKLSEVNIVCPKDRQCLSAWNLPIPSVAKTTVPELIHEMAVKQPQEAAICSWGGNLTYEQLDRLSHALMTRFKKHGVAPGVFVPLCLEKSMWMGLAMLAVMKAGGAFVLLDPSYPLTRLRQMCEAVKSYLVVSTNKTRSLAPQIGLQVLVIDEEDPRLLLERVRACDISSPVASCSTHDPMYATFTSGSTGAPKGVVVDQGGYTTSATAHAKQYNFSEHSRVLQFASPGFDSCIIEHISTLIEGGCVCVPNADECRSRLAHTINKYGVNNVCLTPSVARILSPDDLPTLQDLALVGEAVLDGDIARWKPFVQVRNAYGPAECSAVFSVQPSLTVHDPKNIGFPTGGVGWVVHPEDPQVLMPVGSTGELLIEGPIVGPGYLSNSLLTAQNFIHPPKWREQFGDAHGRMYKTGDLVQTTDTGSFRYLGRKDTQVKLHGQRIELGEIEYLLQHIVFTDAPQIVVGIVQHDNIHPPVKTLTACICWSAASDVADEQELDGGVFLAPNDAFRHACTVAESRLSNLLPSFMIPKLFLPVHRMPLTPSGKLDRRQLLTHAGTLSADTVKSYRVASCSSQPPSTPEEVLLQSIWAQVLNKNTELGITESFFNLGGDSVSAMQVGANCQAVGYRVSVADIFQFPTIAQLAHNMKPVSSYRPGVTEEYPEETWFGLSPIQKLFFELCPAGHNRFTQQFLLRLSRRQANARAWKAIEAIVRRHSMLRAQFHRLPSGPWEQRIRKYDPDCFIFREHTLQRLDIGIHEILVESQGLLDIGTGRILVVDIITTPAGEQYMSLMAHHLVIDLVSWRVLLQDLEDFLITGTLAGPGPLSFQQWCHLQEEYVAECLEPRKALPTEVPPAPLTYWGGQSLVDRNTWAEATQHSVTLSPQVTQAILGHANDAFRTRPVELIHAALLYSFLQIFNDRQPPAIYTEGHGREPWDSHIDLSRTVGWFTTLAPVWAPVSKDEDISTVVLRVKEARRAIPSNGWTYFSSRYLHPQGREYHQGQSPMEILFNYTGLFQQLERQDALLELAAIPDHGMIQMPEDMPRFALVDVSAVVMNAQLTISFLYNRHMWHQANLEKWFHECERTFEDLPKALRGHRQLSPSDFPLLLLDNREQFEKLMIDIGRRVRLSEIEDIYPCSPAQIGMWLSQTRDPQKYWSRLQWSLYPSTDHCTSVSISQVKLAWQKVVNLQPILRTVFFADPSQGCEPLQIVLKTAKADMVDCEVPTWAPEDEMTPLLVDHCGESGNRVTPAHRLKVHSMSDNSVRCELVINHMLIDGCTQQILLTGLQQAYDDLGPMPAAPPYSDYISYINGQSEVESKAYWQRYLDGVQPCLFPRLSVSPLSDQKGLRSLRFTLNTAQCLRDFCQRHTTTIPNLFQVAWGLLLQAYTGSDSVCFGFLVSARDSPIPNVQEIAGPIINLLVCRFSFDPQESIFSTLANSQAAYGRGLDNRHSPLPDIMHSLGLTGRVLFNTALSLQKSSDEKTPLSPSTVVKNRGGCDATEYELTLNIVERETTIEAELGYWSYMLTELQAELISGTFQHIVWQLVSGASNQLGQLDLVSQLNWDCVMDWNKQAPVSIRGCIHDEITQFAFKSPASPAVTASDGSLTYAELDRFSTILAERLSQRGVGPNVFVPLYTDKSRWVIIGVLAVLKAGGAFVLLDPSHPMERLREIVKNDIHSQLILTCTRLASLARTISDTVIVLEQLGSEVNERMHRIPQVVARVCPATAAYAVFTSGSSGKPKASVVGHGSYITGARAHSKALGLAEGSRVLQFASFAFDASVMEILTTLMVGGCICIPCDKDRQERLLDFIQEAQVDWALLTPSVARTLDPRKAAALKTLVLGGESLSPADVQKWSPYVKLMSAYGPSECSVIATVQDSTTALMNEPTNIGRPTGARAWVTDQNDSDRLVPVGAVGELLIEGPIVGQGYLGRPELTAATFIYDMPWLKHVSCSPDRRPLYKTGDVVRMLIDGTLMYMGRKDRQIKLRGQRIELAEVEYHVRHCFPGTPDVFADVVASNDADQAYLIAAVSQPTQDQNEFVSAVSIAESRLQRAVPPFMRPSFLFRLQEVPRLPSGKVDRSRIRQQGINLMQKQRHKCNNVGKDWKATDLSPEEQALRELWSRLLHCRVGAIGPEDDFFSLGGDSITAMRLVSAARTRGLHVAVADVFAHSQLRELARSLTSQGQESHGYEPTSPRVTPFSLIPYGRKAEIQNQAMIKCSIDQADIEDIYPCTAIQAGMAAMTAERAGAYVAHHEYSIPADINFVRLRHAWEKVVTHHPILRTRLIQTTDLACWQVIVRNQELGWVESQIVETEDFALGGLDPISDRDHGIFGIPLFHVRVSRGATCKMTLTMHHAVYDAWTLPQFLRCAHMAYTSDKYLPSDPVPFQHFIEYTCSQVDRSLAHWRTEFEGLDAEPFPMVPSISYRAKAVSQVEHSIPIEVVKEASVTRTAAVRLAWALVQAQYQSKSEIVYGVVSSGRAAPVPGVETISGPTLCAFPLRVSIDTNEKIGKALKNLQARIAKFASFEHVGLQQIAKLGPEATRACSFQTLLNVEPAEDLVDSPAYKSLFDSIGVKARDGAFATYAIVLNCVLKADSITVTATFDDQVCSHWKMGHIINQFSHILQNVHRRLQSPIGDVLGELNPFSMQQLKNWNGAIPDMMRETVPGAIQEQCSRQPLAPAVCSWDGSFTYSDLDRWSNKVASLLQRRNIHPKSIVPVLMDRSRWVMVAMLGIIKAGAAFVLLEPSYAFARLRLICNDIDASVILTRAQNVKAAQALVSDTMVVDESLRDGSPNIKNDSHAWSLSPNKALYCVFTSGSTGKPKGIIINHGPFVTMSQEYARRTRIAPDARILHFASYAFDVSILETLSTLIAGACVCVLSEAGRKERFAEAVQDLRPSHALLTPSLARVLPRNSLGSVHTLMLVGEATRHDDLVKWTGKLHLMNLYGPAECTILSSMQSNCTLETTPANIGHPVASIGWVTDPRNPYQLAPIGAVGELVLQGPLLGRGYLNDPDQTAAAFFRGPAWLDDLGLESDVSRSKVYRTGDLVRYEDDGSLVYHGRKDTQAKLRGQRLELQEVEEQIQRSFPGILTDVIAEIVTPIDVRAAPCLVAFLSIGGKAHATEKPPEFGEQPLDVVSIPNFPDDAKETESRLTENLPGYMVPSIFVPLRQMPRTVGGKVDRRGLRQAASSMTRQQLAWGSTNTASEKQKTMSSDTERLLQSIWARALGIAPENIGAEDSFFRLGGDSISAMQATSQARAAGIEHAVADLFQWKSIRRIVEKFAKLIHVPQAFGHQGAEQGRQEEDVSAGVETSSDDKAEEILPCTPVQRGILLTQMQDPLSYAPHFIWKVRENSATPVDVDRVARVWQQVVERHCALRVVFENDTRVDGDGFRLRLFRHIDAPVYILSESPVDSKGLPVCLTQEDVRRDSDIPHQFTICHSTDGLIFCRLDINHAIIDATSVSLLVQDLMSLYDGQVLSDGAQDAYRDYLHFVHRQPQEPAHAYWSSYLTGMQPVSLPYPLMAGDKTIKPLERLEVPLACSGSDINTFCRRTDWTASNLLYFAWAITLGVFSGSDDVCFGALTEGRHVPVQNIQYTVGQIANMAVCRVRLTPHISLDQAALSLQESYGHILSFQTFPLSEIARAAGVTVQELASTAINVQYALSDTRSEQPNCSLTFEPVGGHDPTSQDIMLYALIDQHGGVQVSMSYRPSRISTIMATQLADYFSEAISIILRNPCAKIGELNLLSANDHERLLRWNTALCEPQLQCVHQEITQCARRQPRALAVCGFDGSFSYAELESQSTQLAEFMVARGVTPTTYVPLCFERSRWTTVAMLAVMKAGGTFVPLDPTHPITRLQELCRRVDARFVLTSVAQAHMGPKLADDTIVVGHGNYDHRARSVNLPTMVDPEKPAYVLFTSGTTGTPKGVMIPHVSFLTAAQAQMRAFSIGLGSRVLQFSSYAFDVSVMEILTTLIAGGTVCVISEPERSRMLLDGVCPITVTHAFLTPSIAGMLDASRASWMETLVLLGEPMSTSHIQQWANVCHLMNAYGPTECSVLNTATSRIVPGCDPKDMGYALGVHFWVVDQNDHDRLLPIGAVGELVIGGPPVGLGYINNPKRTADAFIEPPSWLQSLFPKDISFWRLYKTGDLVRYNTADGTLRYEGRKDRQIKVRGQRVELEDIEYHTARCFPGAADVVTEQILLPQDSAMASSGESSVGSRIVACIYRKGLTEQSTSNSLLEHDVLAAPSREFNDDAAIAAQRLRDVLPSFMVPDLFLPMVNVPRQKSGKTDRRRLREAIVALRPKDCQSLSCMTEPSKRSLQTATEKKFHMILSQLLKLAPHMIGADDSLFNLGGDSIIAMKIAAHAQAAGLDIKPHEVLRNPTIRSWACVVDGKHAPVAVAQMSPPISLVADSHSAEIFRSFFNNAPPFSHDNVQSILPVLDIQSYYLNSSSIVNFAELFSTSLDTNRLREACRTVVSQYSILRTVFVTVDHQCFQVILRNFEPDFTEVEVEDAEVYLQLETKRQVAPSTPLGTVPVSFSVLTSTSSAKCAFIARISHAQYDGACLPILWNAIKSAYNGESLPAATELTDVVHHRLGKGHPRSLSFWTDYLRGASSTALDPLCITSLPNPPGDIMSPTTARREIRRPVPMAGATVATLIKAALAWLFARYQSQYDIILGQVVHGRGSDLPNIDKVFGPCLTFLPLRVTIDPTWTVSDLLRHTQAQQVETVPHDAVALRDIVKQCTNWPEDAQFGCLVHHQPLQSASEPLALGDLSSYSNITWASSRPPAGQVDVISIERQDSLDLVIASPANVLDQTSVEWMADRLSEAIELFCQLPHRNLSELEPDRVDPVDVLKGLSPSFPTLVSSAECE